MTGNTVELNAVVPVMPVDDLTEAIAFYRDRLGFALAFEQGDYVGMTRSGVEVHLDGVSGIGVGLVSCRISAREIDALHAELESRGVVDRQEPLETKPWGLRQFGVRDPSGNHLTFVQPA